MTSDRATGYSLPGVMKPGGNCTLATTITYAAFWAVTRVTGPNGANSTTTYDSTGGRESWIPDGAETNYTYQYMRSERGGREYADGERMGARRDGRRRRWMGSGGRSKEETGHETTTLYVVDTQYAPCACSPIGKMYRMRRPHAPGGTELWTTYFYDGSGRTL